MLLFQLEQLPLWQAAPAARLLAVWLSSPAGPCCALRLQALVERQEAAHVLARQAGQLLV